MSVKYLRYYSHAFSLLKEANETRQIEGERAETIANFLIGQLKTKYRSRDTSYCRPRELHFIIIYDQSVTYLKNAVIISRNNDYNHVDVKQTFDPARVNSERMLNKNLHNSDLNIKMEQYLSQVPFSLSLSVDSSLSLSLFLFRTPTIKDYSEFDTPVHI